MNFSNQLVRLILDFYREDPEEYRAIALLQNCRLSRRWGTLRIACNDVRTAEDLIRAIDCIREPVAKLRLAKRLKVFVDGAFTKVFPVSAPGYGTDAATVEWGKSGFFF
ncbi:MAG: hypothetical protein HC824_12370 [Synechococcales cyanobacterium RM1_1_8]|nr:hypothetical protein [Synechococcales cyanobacterium RM1_1_8]